MGIVNLTPDSFSDGGRYKTPDAAVDAALEMAATGASVLDLGAESSRPGSDPVTPDEELRRLLPVLERLRPRTDLPISIDTTKASVARACLELGADWINDITALGGDAEMADVVAGAGAVVVLMHMRGTPKTMQDAPRYDDVVGEVRDALMARVRTAIESGIGTERILIDPGIGFGKRLEDNLALLRRLDVLVETGYPVLLGASRKRFLGALIDSGCAPRPIESRDAATIATLALGWFAGVTVHRVHNVRYAMDALRTLTGIGRRETLESG